MRRLIQVENLGGGRDDGAIRSTILLLERGYSMPNDEIRLLLESLGGQILESQNDPTGAVAMLISETVKFRDQLRREAGAILTVGDTRAALDALEQYLSGNGLPSSLSGEQAALAQLYVDRLTLFKRT
jgi:hypothetical protein